jgi:hypothetical protein
MPSWDPDLVNKLILFYSIDNEGKNVIPQYWMHLSYQISLTYLKRQNSYGPTDSKFANPFRLNKELTPFYVFSCIILLISFYSIDNEGKNVIPQYWMHLSDENINF